MMIPQVYTTFIENIKSVTFYGKQGIYYAMISKWLTIYFGMAFIACEYASSHVNSVIPSYITQGGCKSFLQSDKHF